MTTYKESGVDVSLSDHCSRLAYAAAKRTFKNRAGKIGEPVVLDEGFAGAMDMGDFYLTQNDDGVGTKTVVAEKIGKFDTLGFDLVAMVVDDGVCLGAENIAVTNTIEMKKEDPELIEELMKGLEQAAAEAGVCVPGGEIAIVGDEVKSFTWKATAVGVLKKNRIITGQEVKTGDEIVGIRSAGFRSNGFSLIRKILEDSYGEDCYQKDYGNGKSWGEMLLTPAKIYCKKLASLIGDFGTERQVEVHGIVHVTGGGIPNNLMRLLSDKNLGAKLELLIPPHEMMLRLQELGEVDDNEAYTAWNMGVGMMLITPDGAKAIELLEKEGLEAQIMGEVTNLPQIELISQGYFSPGEVLNY